VDPCPCAHLQRGLSCVSDLSLFLPSPLRRVSSWIFIPPGSIPSRIHCYQHCVFQRCSFTCRVLQPSSPSPGTFTLPKSPYSTSHLFRYFSILTVCFERRRPPVLASPFIKKVSDFPSPATQSRLPAVYLL